jgi:methylmalonyl-CoA mutase N-terminal domain/subunit
LSVDDFVARLSFNFDIFGNLWEQVSKFRAARRLWAKLIKERYGATDPKTMQMKMIAGGGGGGLTIEQPENNIVRSAYYALISALSGTQTMALCSYDEAYTIPTEKAATLSLRTMQIVVEEMGMRDTVDALAGSYYIESLTNELERRIVAEMKRVDEEWGGIVKAISEGRVQREVARQAYLYEKGVQDGSIVKVGVNKYRTSSPGGGRPEAGGGEDVALHEYNLQAVEEQQARLAQVKGERDGAAVSQALESLRQAAAGKENVMPYVLEAARAYATLGEMTQVLKDVFGEFREPVGL